MESDRPIMQDVECSRLNEQYLHTHKDVSQSIGLKAQVEVDGNGEVKTAFCEYSKCSGRCCSLKLGSDHEYVRCIYIRDSL